MFRKKNSLQVTHLSISSQIKKHLSREIELKDIPKNKIAKEIVFKKFFTYFCKFSLFFAVAKFIEPPNTGSVILNGTGRVFSLKPKTGRITKKCKK